MDRYVPDSTCAHTVRPWLAGDELELTRLFERTFGRPITEEHWRWKLRPQPHSLENVWLAISDHKPVFQYAAIPIRFNAQKQQVQALVSVDTMTAPEFRRRGLLTQVATHAYASWRDSGAAFVIGLPNENWGTRARALGWQPLFPLQWLVRPLRPEAMLARQLGTRTLSRATMLGTLWNAALRHRVRPTRDIELIPVRRAGSEFDRVWDRCKSDWAFSTIRDAKWVQWRFLSPPSRRYEVTLASRNNDPVGYLAHAIADTGTSAHVAELCAARADLETRNTLLADLIARLLATPVQSVSVLSIPGTADYRWLRRAGFLPRPAFQVQLVPLRADLPLDNMQDRQQWLLTGADFDVV